MCLFNTPKAPKPVVAAPPPPTPEFGTAATDNQSSPVSSVDPTLARGLSSLRYDLTIPNTAVKGNGLNLPS